MRATTNADGLNAAHQSRLLSSQGISWAATSMLNLVQVGLLKPAGLTAAICSIYQHGPNLMVLLDFARRMTPNTATLNHQYSYQQSYQLALSLASHLQDRLPATSRLKPKVALLCANHPSSILALFATARLGADITLLNTDLSPSQIKHIIRQHAFDMVICDDEFTSAVINDDLVPNPLIISRTQLSEIIALTFANLTQSASKPSITQSSALIPLARKSSGKINVLTGGTSGRIKFAKREPSVLAMLLPFLALLNEVKLAKYQTVYIAAPIYHGYGLAALLISVLLSARLFISEKFDTSSASQLIIREQIEVLIVVPTLLKRLLDYGDEHTLTSVRCILSGGAKLEPSLVKRTLAQTKNTLFNLYGTSEAGFGVMATPADLRRHPDSIGKAIMGVSWQITESQQPVPNQTIGILSLCTAWAMDNPLDTPRKLRSNHKLSGRSHSRYISTGDLAYANKEGYLFLKGRADDMIVSGGENVYPTDIENTLNQHPQVDQVAVIAVDNEEFGKRLIAFVSLIATHKPEPYGISESSNLSKPTSPAHANVGQLPSTLITAEQLMEWLKPKLARYQMPRQIVLLDELPMTKTGKVSHAQLRALFQSYGS